MDIIIAQKSTLGTKKFIGVELEITDSAIHIRRNRDKNSPVTTIRTKDFGLRRYKGGVIITVD